MSLLPFARMRISLNMLAFDLSCFHKLGVNTLTLLSCSFLPGSDRPFIKGKGTHNRLEWAAIRK